MRKRRKFMFVRLDLTHHDAIALEEQAFSFGMTVSDFVTFLCVNSVARYRVACGEKNMKKSEV